MVNTIGNFLMFLPAIEVLDTGKAIYAFCYQTLNAMKHTNSKAVAVT